MPIGAMEKYWIIAWYYNLDCKSIRSAKRNKHYKISNPFNILIS
jgi:hypothetical protein